MAHHYISLDQATNTLLASIRSFLPSSAYLTEEGSTSHAGFGHEDELSRNRPSFPVTPQTLECFPINYPPQIEIEDELNPDSNDDDGDNPKFDLFRGHCAAESKFNSRATVDGLADEGQIKLEPVEETQDRKEESFVAAINTTSNDTEHAYTHTKSPYTIVHQDGLHFEDSVMNECEQNVLATIETTLELPDYSTLHISDISDEECPSLYESRRAQRSCSPSPSCYSRYASPEAVIEPPMPVSESTNQSFCKGFTEKDLEQGFERHRGRKRKRDISSVGFHFRRTELGKMAKITRI